MKISETIALISVIVASLSLLLAFFRSQKADSTDQVKAITRMSTKLDMIQDGINEIRVEQRALRESHGDMAKQIAALEASCKSAHKRIDQLERIGMGGLSE